MFAFSLLFSSLSTFVFANQFLRNTFTASLSLSNSMSEVIMRKISECFIAIWRSTLLGPVTNFFNCPIWDLKGNVDVHNNGHLFISKSRLFTVYSILIVTKNIGCTYAFDEHDCRGYVPLNTKKRIQQFQFNLRFWSRNHTLENPVGFFQFHRFAPEISHFKYWLGISLLEELLNLTKQNCALPHPISVCQNNFTIYFYLLDFLYFDYRILYLSDFLSLFWDCSIYLSEASLICRYFFGIIVMQNQRSFILHMVDFFFKFLSDQFCLGAYV